MESKSRAMNGNGVETNGGALLRLSDEEICNGKDEQDEVKVSKGGVESCNGNVKQRMVESLWKSFVMKHGGREKKSVVMV